MRSVLKPGDPEAANKMLEERLAEARRAAAAIDGTSPEMSASELAARATASLIPATSLVRGRASAE